MPNTGREAIAISIYNVMVVMMADSERLTGWAFADRGMILLDEYRIQSGASGSLSLTRQATASLENLFDGIGKRASIMRLRYLLFCMWIAMAGMLEHSVAVEVGVTSDFSTGRQGWEGSGLEVGSSGGPTGNNDSYLKISADGMPGPGSRWATYIKQPNWIGDFKTAGITSLDVDVTNNQSSPVPLDLRLVLFGPSTTSNRWTSKTSLSVPKDGKWHRLSFPISVDELQRVQGNATFDAMISNVVQLQLRHDSGSPSAQGTPVTASGGIDNVTLRGPAFLPSDFDRNGVRNVEDLNLLLGEVRAGTNQKNFDRTEDGFVDINDIIASATWRADFNTYIGDANLDGEFNTSDFVILFQAGQYEDAVSNNSKWQTGDWNGDGDFNTRDLLFAFQEGGFEQGPRVVVQIPEPASGSLMAGCLLLLVGKLRKRMDR